MKRVCLLFFALITTISAICQTDIPDGDRCFDSGDYACAITNYDNAFKSSSGKDKQIADIKLTRAKWCFEHIKFANQAFAAKNYSTAKDEYQKVLDSNPKDRYAQSQISKCDNALNPPKLRKATTAEITDIWNNKYGVQPQRRQNLINAGIDPDDAQARLNAGEGKPQVKEKQATKLSVSKSTLYFTSYGETSELIQVYSDASTFSVPSVFVPSWCTVKTNSNGFTVTASANPNYTSRKDFFIVKAGGKEVRINVEQFARTNPNTQQSRSPIKQTTQSKANKCFNCPNTRYTVGITAGKIKNSSSYSDGVQFGLKIEPLFKYGFGLNTGLLFEGYTNDLISVLRGDDELVQYAIKLPLDLEYRLNFSKWFNIFGYAGLSASVITNPLLDDYWYPISYEFGGGLRINHIQFSVEQSQFANELNDIQFYELYQAYFKRMTFSVSYMF